MPIAEIEQPEYITVSDNIRLRRFDGRYDFALKWYQDTGTVMMVDGVREPYTAEKLARMYEYLNVRSELYFIEYLTRDGFVPIGDVSFRQEDMPIVIGDAAYRGMGIGKKVVSALINRGKELGYEYLAVREIYSFNTRSQRLFESAGFTRHHPTEKGFGYKLTLK